MTDPSVDPGEDTVPPGLGTAGALLWLDVTHAYDLDAHEAALLLQAARTADALDALAAVVAREGVVLGDGRAHPALVEQRQQSLTLARLVAALRLPDGESGEALHRPQRRGGARGTYPGPRAVA